MRLSTGEGRLWICCLALILLLVLSQPAMALTADDIVIVPAKSWIVADGVDSTDILITVANVTQPRSVDVMLDDDRYGIISPVHFHPGFSQNFHVTFLAKTESGAVKIQVNVTEQGVSSAYNDVILYLDHGSPVRIHQISYDEEVDAGYPTEVRVILEDAYGNPVDSKRERYEGTEPEKVHFSVGSISGGARFLNALTECIAEDDENGVFLANLTVDTRAGPNWVRIEPPAPLPAFPITINGIGAIPFTLTQAFNPSGIPCPRIPADGNSQFVITYSAFDRWGNPSPDRLIQVATSLGETQNLTTNPDGTIIISYGPKFLVGNVTFIANSVDNMSAACSQFVQFISTEPTSMLLTASPQAMPSLDVNGTTSANIMAKVIDVSGNPVANETVYFTIQHPSYPSSQSQNPTLSASSAVTDQDGFAIVQFHPGRFVTSGPDYSPQVSANCTVQASWADVPGSIRLMWMNYPYVSVETDGTPQTLPVNTTADITIRLRGDGWAMQPIPIEVVLCTDRSGSMLYDVPDRMYNVREAAKQFVDHLSASRDTIGLVSFGRNGYISRPGINTGLAPSWIDNAYIYPTTYSDYATVDRTISGNFDVVKSDLDRMVPDHGTPMRSAIYKSINEMRTHGHTTGTVRAIILLSDGDYNWYGDPLARGSGSTESPTSYGELTSAYYRFSGLGSGKFSNQNMSVYARNNNVKIYAIGYADQLSTGGHNTLRTLAEGTGGKYYTGNAGNIHDVYTAIAGELKTEAGVNTVMDLDFSVVSVNNVTVPGSQVFSYQYVPGVSTYETSYNTTFNPLPGFPKPPRDDTANWNDDQNLHFDVGTIRTGQTWEVTFRLKVLKEGNINVFGPGSLVRFNNGTSTLAVPDTFITAVPNLTAAPIPPSQLVIERPPGLVHTNNATMVEFLYLGWYVTYNGPLSYTETLTYQYRDPATWAWSPSRSIDTLLPKTNGTWIPGDASMDVRLLPDGDYRIQLVAAAENGPSDSQNITVTLGDIKPYIALK